MPTFFRIQPKGLGLRHDSESSEGAVPGIDVFTSASQTFFTDVPAKNYGDEVVVIRAPRSWANHDVEGRRIDPRKAKLLARFSWVAWTAIAAGIAGLPASAHWECGADFSSDGEIWRLDDADLKKLDRKLKREFGS